MLKSIIATLIVESGLAIIYKLPPLRITFLPIRKGNYSNQGKEKRT